MASVKEGIAELLGRLPEDSTLEDIQYHLYVLEKVRRGLEQVDRGETVSQEAGLHPGFHASPLREIYRKRFPP